MRRRAWEGEREGERKRESVRGLAWEGEHEKESVGGRA